MNLHNVFCTPFSTRKSKFFFIDIFCVNYHWDFVLRTPTKLFWWETVKLDPYASVYSEDLFVSSWGPVKMHFEKFSSSNRFRCGAFRFSYFFNTVFCSTCHDSLLIFFGRWAWKSENICFIWTWFRDMDFEFVNYIRNMARVEFLFPKIFIEKSLKPRTKI